VGHYIVPASTVLLDYKSKHYVVLRCCSAAGLQIPSSFASPVFFVRNHPAIMAEGGLCPCMLNAIHDRVVAAMHARRNTYWCCLSLFKVYKHMMAFFAAVSSMLVCTALLCYDYHTLSEVLPAMQAVEQTATSFRCRLDCM
jgi:hypothetical protein